MRNYTKVRAMSINSKAVGIGLATAYIINNFNYICRGLAGSQNG